jgi:hypothetical protein
MRPVWGENAYVEVLIGTRCSEDGGTKGGKIHTHSSHCPGLPLPRAMPCTHSPMYTLFCLRVETVLESAWPEALSEKGCVSVERQPQRR